MAGEKILMTGKLTRLCWTISVLFLVSLGVPVLVKRSWPSVEGGSFLVAHVSSSIAPMGVVLPTGLAKGELYLIFSYRVLWFPAATAKARRKVVRKRSSFSDRDLL